MARSRRCPRRETHTYWKRGFHIAVGPFRRDRKSANDVCACVCMCVCVTVYACGMRHASQQPAIHSPPPPCTHTHTHTRTHLTEEPPPHNMSGVQEVQQRVRIPMCAHVGVCVCVYVKCTCVHVHVRVHAQDSAVGPHTCVCGGGGWGERTRMCSCARMHVWASTLGGVRTQSC